MEMYAIAGSSNIEAIGYDPEKRTLRVRFTNGKEYVYDGVPLIKWHAFRMARSKGSYFHASIKPFHKAHRIT